MGAVGGHRRGVGRLAGACVGVLLALAPVQAQEAPYLRDLMRLSEILGGLHHLRPLCGAEEQRLWRDKMNALLQAETLSPEIRQRMIGRFNRSYRELSEVHRTCTPAAREIIDRFLGEGARITDDLVGRYGKTP